MTPFAPFACVAMKHCAYLFNVLSLQGYGGLFLVRLNFPFPLMPNGNTESLLNWCFVLQEEFQSHWEAGGVVVQLKVSSSSEALILVDIPIALRASATTAVWWIPRLNPSIRVWLCCPQW